jgi:phage protein U
MMAALGQFIFALNPLAFQEMRRSSNWRHPSNSRVMARPAHQFVGPGDETITLTGLLAPEFVGDRHAIQRLRDMADKGYGYALVNGAGEAFGAWAITDIEETGTIFVKEGVPRRVEFSITLIRVDDALTDPGGGTGEEWNEWWTDDNWEWWL